MQFFSYYPICRACTGTEGMEPWWTALLHTRMCSSKHPQYAYAHRELYIKRLTLADGDCAFWQTCQLAYYTAMGKLAVTILLLSCAFIGWIYEKEKSN